MGNGRAPLRPGSAVSIGGDTYRLFSDKGGRCLAYNAECKPSEYEKKIGMPSIPIEQIVGVRTRQINRALRGVEVLDGDSRLTDATEQLLITMMK